MAKTTLRALVESADPEWRRKRRNVIEYEFDARGPGRPEVHEGGKRVFRGNYDVRGPYKT